MRGGDAPLLITVDDAVEPPLLQAIDRAVRAVGEEASYWRTFWYPLAAAPTCQPERLARALRAHVPATDRIVGVEWWLGRMRTTDVLLDFHHDRDLSLFEETGRLAHPKWSSVFFLNAVRGGSLLVTDQTLVRRGAEIRLSPAEATRSASTRPAANRFARFSGRLLHGVLDANDRVPTGRLPGPPAPPRLTVVLNWWTRRPRGVDRWRGEVYPALGL
jgi:hypothetical protein